MAPAAWLELRLALVGMLRLARGDRSGLACFDPSLESFWRSFRAAALCYPLYLILLAFRVTEAEWDASGIGRIVVVETIAYVISWVAFPLVMLPLSRWLDREDHFLGFMVVYNWCQLPQTMLFVLVGLLFPASATPLVELGATIAVVVYEWYIARVALATTGVAATVVVLADIVLGALVSRVTDSLY